MVRITSVKIERPIYQIEDLNRETMYEKPRSTAHTSYGHPVAIHRTFYILGTSTGRPWDEVCCLRYLQSIILLLVRSKCRSACKSIKTLSCVTQTIPILAWLPEYSWKNSFLGDIVAGTTVGIMHIPQGMAFALLGNVPPIVGLYMAFFPVLVYFAFGTSRHISVGTFAVVCLLTGEVITQHGTIEAMGNGNGTSTDSEDPSSDRPSYTNMEIATTLTFTVAMFQLAMYVLRLGMVSQLLSDTSVNGFICASAFHVVSSQFKDLFDLPIQKRGEYFYVVLTIYDTIYAFYKVNIYTLITSLLACIILIIGNDLIRPWLAKRTRIPLPTELIAVVIGTVVGHSTNLEALYGISVVKDMPTGLPPTSLPVIKLIPELIFDAFTITIVSYVLTLSMALMLARKCVYELDSNQELLAMGLANMAGTFSSCMPTCASLARSALQEAVGGATQIASVVSCLLLMVILLWIGPLFEPLPRCILASIVVIAIRGILVQCISIIKYCRLSKWDAFVWTVTFMTTLLINIGYGLGAGVIVSLLSVFLQGYNPYACLLGVVPNTNLYLDIERHRKAEEIQGIRIFHYSGSLNFMSRATFKGEVIRKTGLNVTAILRRRARLQQRGLQDNEVLTTKCLIFDFSGLSFIDPEGVECVWYLQMDYLKLGIVTYIAGCPDTVYEAISNYETVEKKTKFLVFAEVHDAVLFAQNNVFNTS